MFSPIKAIIAGALVLAIGVAFLIARPSANRQGPAGSAVPTEMTALSGSA